MVKDKELDAVLKLLPADAAYYFTNAHIPRALPVKDLQEKAAAFGLKGNNYDDVNSAIAAAKLLATKDSVIMVCGSVFLIGEVDY
jgi:dihydrofolate synthase/folylpolyglutamate synthase